MTQCPRPDSSPLRSILPVSLLLLLFTTTGTASQSFRYHEQTGKESFTYLWRAEEEGGGKTVAVTHEQGDETFKSINGDDGATRSWHYQKLPDTDIRAEREGNTIRFSGRFQGKEIDKSESIDSRPWFQPLTYSLQRMVARNQRKAKFWTVRSDNLEMLALQAEKKGSEEIEGEDGATLMADKVVIRLDGFKAHLWASEYWFRQGDSLFVRFQGTQGPPGTAETRITLLTP